ncbi:MAG: arsenite methyltransferase [Bacteroidetes bacterium]|nr:arsenite methyltransferase [Bacteroidota bacterium]
MNNNEKMKNIVKDRYSKIVINATQSSCCGPQTSSCCSDTEDFTVFSDDYTNLPGYTPDADLNLGCGLPTEFAGIKEGDTVIDLGSGAGNDVFVARALAGERGRIIGLDFTEAMIQKANENKTKLGYENVEFVFGDIEKMPIEDNLADVIVSNCVLNLVPDKEKAFSEVYRTMKPGGHFCMSDVVLQGELRDELKESATLYAGCVAGALQQEDYLEIIKNAGFKNIEIKKSKRITLPDELLQKYLDEAALKAFRESGAGIFSITVVGEK